MSIINQDLPVWHEFSLLNPTTLLIRAHRSVLSDINKLNQEYGPIVELNQELGLSAFKRRINGFPWGFGKVFCPLEEGSEWMGWVCPLPKPGKNQGKQLLNISGSLRLLFSCLILSRPTMEINVQLMQVTSWGVSPGQHCGHNINIDFSPRLQSWVGQGRLEHHAEALAQSLITTFRYLGGHAPAGDEKCFRVITYGSRQFQIICGADGCNLTTNDMDMGNGEFDVVSNNVQNVVQQLSLFFLLSKIHDLARVEGC